MSWPAMGSSRYSRDFPYKKMGGNVLPPIPFRDFSASFGDLKISEKSVTMIYAKGESWILN
jgi:hypothetical protein